MKKLKSFNELVENLGKLPGIGKKMALRLAHNICLNKVDSLRLVASIEAAISCVRSCECCGVMSEDELCEFCAEQAMRARVICLVQNARDAMIIEDCGAYNGLYFVLNDTSEESLEKLKNMILRFEIKELLLALPHGLASQSVGFFIEEKLKDLKLIFSQIAQGVPSGVSLENVDFASLNNAISFRTRLG